jgi:hypothetical protein
MTGAPLHWHKRHAILMASQLPDGHADAMLVIEALRELAESYLHSGPAEVGSPAPNVLTFPK